MTQLKTTPAFTSLYYNLVMTGCVHPFLFILFLYLFFFPEIIVFLTLPPPAHSMLIFFRPIQHRARLGTGESVDFTAQTCAL